MKKNLNIKIYIFQLVHNIKNHRHVYEIEKLLKLTREKLVIHLIPFTTDWGILSSIYIYTKNNTSAKKLRNTLVKFYKNSKFIKILKLNSPLGSGNVLNTNNCEISICETRIKKRFIIFSAIDNLVKGASGQAIQNMNLIYRFPENLGLKWELY